MVLLDTGLMGICYINIWTSINIFGIKKSRVTFPNEISSNQQPYVYQDSGNETEAILIHLYLTMPFCGKRKLTERMLNGRKAPGLLLLGSSHSYWSRIRTQAAGFPDQTLACHLPALRPWANWPFSAFLCP